MGEEVEMVTTTGEEKSDREGAIARYCIGTVTLRRLSVSGVRNRRISVRYGIIQYHTVMGKMDDACRAHLGMRVGPSVIYLCNICTAIQVLV